MESDVGERRTTVEGEREEKGLRDYDESTIKIRGVALQSIIYFKKDWFRSSG